MPTGRFYHYFRKILFALQGDILTFSAACRESNFVQEHICVPSPSMESRNEPPASRKISAGYAPSEKMSNGTPIAWLSSLPIKRGASLSSSSGEDFDQKGGKLPWSH